MEKKIDSSDGFEVYYHGFMDDFNICLKKDDEDFYLIYGYDIHNTDSNDKRMTIAKVVHKLNKEEHDFSICIDYKNHIPTSKFHINIDWKGKQVKCKTCNDKIIKDFPLGLDHMSIPFQIGIGKGNYKIIKNELIMKEILVYLKNNLKDYSLFKPICSVNSEMKKIIDELYK
jgi:hypothetical protein